MNCASGTVPAGAFDSSTRKRAVAILRLQLPTSVEQQCRGAGDIQATIAPANCGAGGPCARSALAYARPLRAFGPCARSAFARVRLLRTHGLFTRALIENAPHDNTETSISFHYSLNSGRKSRFRRKTRGREAYSNRICPGRINSTRSVLPRNLDFLPQLSTISEGLRVWRYGQRS